MDYISESLEYLPKFDLDAPIININCRENVEEKFFYNLTVNVDGSIVGDLSFTQKNDLIFIRESNFQDQHTYLIEDAMNEMKIAFPHSNIIDISEFKHQFGL